jgi:hypothetical protein
MDETYRMLGREHEADLERDALKWRRAAELRANAPSEDRPAQRSQRASSRAASARCGIYFVWLRRWRYR